MIELRGVIAVATAMLIAAAAQTGIWPQHCAAASSIITRPGQAGSRAREARFGLNFTFTIYQFDEARSSPIEPEIRLPQTFDTPEAERGFLERRFGLQQLLPRHVRSVGLEGGEFFRDGVGMGDQPFIVEVKAVRVSEFFAEVDLVAHHGSSIVLAARNIRFQNYETVLIKGGKGRFGVRIFQGPEGTERAAAERSLLISATAVIVPPSRLGNRPHDISHPTDEFGREMPGNPDDLFVPPAVTESYKPRFNSRRIQHASISVEGVITPEGRPTNVRVIRSFDAAYDDVALDAYRQFKFRPATLNGKPIHATLRSEVTFASSP